MGIHTGRWLSSAELCQELAIGRRTLTRLKRSAYFKEGHHYRKVNPSAPRSNLLWNLDRVLIRMGIPPEHPAHATEWRAPYGTYSEA